MVSELPVVDLSAPDEEAFRDAVHDVGFFYLVGHGIPDEVITGAFAAATRFFALPAEAKLGVEMLRSPHFRGYTRTGGELTRGRVDWREQIDLAAEREPVRDEGAPAYMRLEGPNLWPAAQPELREVFTDRGRRCSAVATRLMRSLAEALGNRPDAFDAAFGDRCLRGQPRRAPGVRDRRVPQSHRAPGGLAAEG